MSDTLCDCRLNIAGQADTRSLATIVRDVVGPLGPDATDEAKVLALYHWIREHLFVYPCVPSDLYADFNSALNVINWWGYGLCGTHAKVLGLLASHLLGWGNTRLIGMGEREPGSWKAEVNGPRAFVWSLRQQGFQPYGGQGHTSMEVRWDGQWHFLDVMVGFYRRDAKGRIVSIDELLNNPDLVNTPVDDPEGNMPYGPEPEIFFASKVGFHAIEYNAWPGRPRPLNLRPGERFVFLGERIPGAYYVHPEIRRRFGSDQLAPGPRGHLPDRPIPHWGNGEHVAGFTLRPDSGDPFWCPETGDWHVEVELPWPIVQIHWKMDEGCSGFLEHEPSTGDQIRPIDAVGRVWQPETARPATRYRIICRSPGRTQPMRLSLRTVVQLNPLVVPRLQTGENRVTLACDGDGPALSARFVYQLDGDPHSVDIHGTGEHTIPVASGDLKPITTILTHEEPAD